MALITADRVKEITSSTGVGSLTLTGAVANYRRFSSVCSIGDTCYYVIEDQVSNAWEVGLGTYSSANTLTRTSVLASSNSNSPVSFGSGKKAVWIDIPAAQINTLLGGSTGSTGGGSSGGSSGGATGGTYVSPYGRPAELYGAMTMKEDFLGTALNRSLWSERNSLFYEAYNGKDNVKVENGNLYMWPESPWTDSEAGGEFTEHNATITTDGTFAQKYGYFEICAKLPTGVGPWPAFWLYNHDVDEGETDPVTGLPAVGDLRPEIDILEAYSGGGAASGWSTASYQPNNYAGTVWPRVFTGDIIAERKLDQTIGNVRLDTDFHRFACHWDASGIQFYFDGRPVGTKVDTSSEYAQYMYVLLDLWMGSASGNPNTGPLTTGQSNSFIVAYCYCWHLADGTSTVVTDLPLPDTSGNGNNGGTATNYVDPASGSVSPYGLTAADWGPLVFSDEFNGTSLNSQVWTDLQPWDDQNVVNYNVSSGSLNIFPQSDSSGVFHTREISTRGAYATTYGYFEAEMQLCKGQGTRCMFGLRAYDADGTAHFLNVMNAYPGLSGWHNGSGGANRFTGGIYDIDTVYNEVDSGTLGDDLSAGMHKYGIKWDNTGFQLYLDGATVGTFQSTTLFNGKQLSPAIALEMGNGGAGTPSATDNSLTPQGSSNSLKVNYVRGWKPASGSATPPTIRFYGASLVNGTNGGTGPDPVTSGLPETVAADTGWTVTKTAHPGTNSSQFIAGSSGWTRTVDAEFAAITESVVVVNFVINDWVNSETQYKSNLNTIITSARSHGKTIVLMGSQTTYQSLSGGTADSDVWVADANQWMRDVAASASVPMIDIHAYLTQWELDNGVTASQFTPDGLHPIQTGYTLLGHYASQRLHTILGV